MLKEIFKDSKQNLKKNWLMSFMLCLIGIISTALVASLIFIPMFGEFLTVFIIMPIVLVPLLFSLQMLHFGLRENVQPCGKLFFRFFKAYFSPGIMGVYRVINTIMFAFLAEMATSFVVGGILVAVVQTNEGFMEALKAVQDAIAATDQQALELALSDPQIRTLAFSSYVPGFGVGALVAFLSASFNSMSIYFKVKNPMINPAFSTRMYTYSKNRIRGTLIKEYWGLNWPIFVLFAIGFGSGVAIAYFTPEMPYQYGLVFGMLIGLGAMILYMPVFMSNIESIYLAHHESHFAKAPADFAQAMQANLNAQMGMMEQQMKDLQRQQDEMSKANKTNDDSNNNDSQSENDKVDTASTNNVVDAEVKDDKNNDNA